jgi:hypothetical protein
LNERGRGEDGSIDVRLGGEMDDRVDPVGPDQLADEFGIADIAVDKNVPIRGGQILEVLPASGIG